MSTTTRIERDLAATVGLSLYSLAVAVGFARVFSGWEFLTDLIVLIIVGHGASFALRRARVSGWIAIPVVTILLLWLLLVQHYRETMTWLIPRGATWDQLDLELGLVRDQFQTAVAPVLYGAGWAPLAGFALVIAIVMADAFAFRAEARGEALVPGGVLFIFIAALAAERLRVLSTVLLIGAGVLAVIALRALHDRSRRVELSTRRGAGGALIPASIGAALAVALLAGVVGPRVPGARAEPLYDTRGRGNGVTEVISPLVDIRSRLTNRSETELFRVFSEQAAYWRVTALPEFDGRTFRLPESPLAQLDEAPSSVPGDRVVQQIQILALGSQLIPAAAEPIEGEGARGTERLRLRIDRNSSSLLAPDDFVTGDEFTVVSAVPRLGADDLRRATSVAPPDEVFLQLPDDLPSVVAERAAEVTAGASSSYERALALQNWFRDEFEYSIDVQSGHGKSAIESFLQEQVGYCEQFSASFAAMARTLGIPTRVAVGYTQGLQGSDGWYSVLGKNAHAWPEVWFDGIGWVAFEPTPGRGAPGAQDYTNVAPEQDDTPVAPGGGGNGDESVATNPTTPTTIVPAPTTTLPPGATTTIADPFTGEIPGLEGEFGGGAPLGDPGDTDDGGGTSIPWSTLIPLLLVATALGAPWAIRRVRARAARRADPADRVTAAWTRATEWAEVAGVAGRPSMTTTEWVHATEAAMPTAARPMGLLAEVVEQISFGRPGSVDLAAAGVLGETFGRDCELWSEQISVIATDHLTPVQRVKRYFTDLR